jgi:hypothetical protein
MFFMPWFSACNINVSGKDLAFGISVNMGMLGSSSGAPVYPWLALVPLCGIGAMLLALANFSPSFVAGRQQPSFMVGTGVVACVILGIVLFGYLRETSSNVNLVRVEYGFPGSIVGAVLILGGALYDMRRGPQRIWTPSGSATAQHAAPSQTLWQAPSMLPPTQEARARLYCKSGALAGQVFELHGDRLTIGRTSENQLRVPDAQASRLHAVIRYAQGRFYLQDQQSTHGTLLNDEPTNASILNDGDRITIGETIFEFRAS